MAYALVQMAGRKTRRDPLEEQLAQLAALRADPTAPESLARLRAALDDGAIVVAAAAAIAQEHEIEALAPALAAAQARLLDAPAESDRGCRAKLALTEALVRCGHRDPELFLRGVRHVQQEGVRGGTEDTAGALRGASAVALAHLDHPETLLVVADLLADPDNSARSGAARAAADLGDRAAVPLLRFKAGCGDDDPQVMSEVFAALLRLDPRSSLGFVVRFLRHDDAAVAEVAAVALGEARLEAALEPLKAWSATPRNAGVGLLAIALMRSERAFEHLLGLVGSAEPRIAVRAVEALATYRHDGDLRRRIEEHVAARGDPSLSQALDRRLGQ